MSNPFRPFVGRPPAIAFDRVGKVIEPGHRVLVLAPEGLVFEVVDVRPVLNPNIPKDQTAVQVRIVADVNVPLIAGVAAQRMVIVGETEARQKAKAAQNGASPAAEEPPAGIVITDGKAE